MIISTVHGNLTADAEYLELSGSKLLKFTVASNNKPKKKGVNPGATFVVCSIWGERGEKLAEYLTKGKPVMVSGELENRSWSTETAKGMSTELNVTTLEFISTGQSSQEDSKPVGSGATKAVSAKVTAPATPDLPDIEI